jgi:S-DNA-T family DNA segregation ATPase FtsK/SpoIIIE
LALVQEPIGAPPRPDEAKRNWTAVASTAVTGLVMAVVMYLITRNPLWAAMPLAAVVAAALPLALRRRRACWWEGVLGLDPRADGQLRNTSPSGSAAGVPIWADGWPGAVDLIGAPGATEALARRLIAAWAPQLPMAALAVPPTPAWSWARFAAASGPAALAVEQIEGGLRLTPCPAWPAARGADRSKESGAGSLPDQGLGPALVTAAGGAGRPTPGSGGASLGAALVSAGAQAAAGVRRWTVKEAGLGLLVARRTGCEPCFAVGLGAAAAESLTRRWAADSRPAAAPDPVPLTAGQIAGNWRDRRELPGIGLASPHSGAGAATGFPGAGGRLATAGALRAGGAVPIDLARDGPHALVAGTSGSGKSEFLRALMLAECLTTPPDRLVIVGLDHKGGATFRDLERLPHVVGVATDLDAAGTSRVLTSLEAELAGRERLLERHGQAAWDELPPDLRPARLLVVVDEFRTLLDALPQAAGRLERLAAQGRSLGMGLVLATQRPAGAVSAQMRANLALRICFRVATDADSLDVLGSADAAALDPAQPGSCIVASAGRAPAHLRIRLMPPPPRRPAQAASWPQRWRPPPAAAPELAALVAAITQAAAAAGAKPPEAPWRPPLPERLSAVESGWPGDGIGVLMGLADRPERQTRHPLSWDPASGHLAVLGPPRSGRTTAAVTAAAGLAAHGWMTHVVTHEPAAFAALAAFPAFGSVIPADAPDRLGELLDRLARARARLPAEVAAFDGGFPGSVGFRPPYPPSLASGPAPMPTGAASGPPGLATPGQPDGVRIALVLDAFTELEGLAAPALGRSLIEALVHGALAPGAALVVTAPAKPARWLGLCPHRLVLPVAELTDALSLGLPRELATAPRLPGRVCYLGGETAMMAQVCLPPPPGALGRPASAECAPGRSSSAQSPLDRCSPGRSSHNQSAAGRPSPGRTWVGQSLDPDRDHSRQAAPVLEPPDKVLALPTRVGPADLPPASSLAVGEPQLTDTEADQGGGRHRRHSAKGSPARAVWVGLGGDCGVPLALPLADGQPIAVVGPPGSGRSTALAAMARRLAAAGHAPAMFPSSPGRRWPDIADALGPGRIVLVDDLESILGPPPATLPAAGTLIATCATATAAAFRAPAQWFHASPLGILLWPHQRGSAAAFGPSLSLSPSLVGPAAAEPPGRGRLVIGSKTWPIQLAT